MGQKHTPVSSTKVLPGGSSFSFYGGVHFGKNDSRVRIHFCRESGGLIARISGHIMRVQAVNCAGLDAVPPSLRDNPNLTHLISDYNEHETSHVKIQDGKAVLFADSVDVQTSSGVISFWIDPRECLVVAKALRHTAEQLERIVGGETELARQERRQDV